MIMILLCGCSTEGKQSCSKCVTFFFENKHIAYPKRIRTVDSREMITGIIVNGVIIQDSISNRNLISEARILTPKEYEDLKSSMFCFIGKEYTYMLSFFEEFDVIQPIYRNDLPDLQFDYLDVYVCSKKYDSKDIYRCDEDSFKRIEIRHTKIDGKKIFTGSETDSVRLHNCLESHGSK